MASQLENTYDLYQDTKQAQNVCFELHKPFGMKQEALNKCVDMKDATTQTISSKFTFGLLSTVSLTHYKNNFYFY